MQLHIPEDLNHELHCCENLKPHIVLYLPKKSGIASWFNVAVMLYYTKQDILNYHDTAYLICMWESGNPVKLLIVVLVSLLVPYSFIHLRTPFVDTKICFNCINLLFIGFMCDQWELSCNFCCNLIHSTESEWWICYAYDTGSSVVGNTKYLTRTILKPSPV
jgi:hypothetical protein